MTTSAHYNINERKAAILMTAEAVFAQYSFAGASIRLITKRSGVNMSMISYYFGSKEALYLSIFKLRLEEITEELTAFEQLDLSPAEKLEKYLTAYIKRVAANQSFHRLLCNELISLQHPAIITGVSATRERIYHFLLKIIESGVTQGYFKKIDQEVFTLNILGLIRSVVTDHLVKHIHLDVNADKDAARRLVDYIMSTISITNS
jgi:TetR/AcrR family transcriptional regulator